MMNISSFETEIVKSEIKKWWENPRNLRWDEFFNTEDSNSYRVLSRANKVIKNLEILNLKNGAKILELGFGGGQTAKMILEKGYYYEGIDISSQLTKCAKKRCLKYVKIGKAKFSVGSIDERLDFEDASFDVIIAVGVFQYITDIPACFSEIKRVLNRGGYLIVCQTNMYNIQKMLMPRYMFQCCVYALGREEFEIAPSIKAILLDSRLGSLFHRFQNSKIFRFKFVLKGHIEYKFGFRKRLFSLWRLSKILEDHNFKILKKCGSPFFYSVTGRNWRISNIFDSLFQRISDKSIPTLSGFADNVIFLAKR